MKAIVFAAGLGTRLHPFTLKHPKALVDVGGEPMLGRVVRRLVDAGIHHIVVNVHHFADQVVEYIADIDMPSVSFAISDERLQLLDTGGGLAHAAQLLADDEPFVACNADILTDFDLPAMIAAHNSTGSDVTLMVSERHTSRLLCFDAHMRLRGWQNTSTGETRPQGFDPTGHQSLAFGGYHIIAQRVLPMLVERARRGEVFSITPFYLDNVDRLDIRGHIPEQPFSWFDVGRPDTLALARQHINSQLKTKN